MNNIYALITIWFLNTGIFLNNFIKILTNVIPVYIIIQLSYCQSNPIEDLISDPYDG